MGCSATQPRISDGVFDKQSPRIEPTVVGQIGRRARRPGSPRRAINHRSETASTRSLCRLCPASATSSAGHSRGSGDPRAGIRLSLAPAPPSIAAASQASDLIRRAQVGRAIRTRVPHVQRSSPMSRTLGAAADAGRADLAHLGSAAFGWPRVVPRALDRRPPSQVW